MKIIIRVHCLIDENEPTCGVNNYYNYHKFCNMQIVNYCKIYQRKVC